MEDTFLSITEVSRYFNIPKSTIYKLSRKGEIPSIKIGKQLRFRKSSLDKWITEKETGSKYQIETAQTPAKAKHILLIDDDELVLKSISRLFKNKGYNVEAVNSPEEALKKVEKVKFDLIITDIRMPGIDGLEAIKRIREINSRYNRPSVPEVVITAYIDTVKEQEAEKLGISDYLYKPFVIADLLKTVDKKLDNTDLN